MAKALEAAAKATGDRATAFPFWLKKYPWTHDMLDAPGEVPRELFASYPPIIRRVFSRKLEHPDETRRMNNRPYFLKYRTHILDLNSLSTQSVGLVGYMKTFENHLAKLDDHIIRQAHIGKYRRLQQNLRRLRIVNFPDYWRLMQDFTLWHSVRYAHQGYLDLGAFVYAGPDTGLKTQHIEDYMDPDTLYGSEETGETRYAVTKRLGKLWAPGMQVYVKDGLDDLWKMGEVLSTDPDTKTCAVALVAVDDVIPHQSWEDMKPFDLYATTRPMSAENPVRGQLAEETSRATYFENLRRTDPTRYEQEWYQHICNKYYDGNAPTGSFRGWRQRFMSWDPQTTSGKRIRWVKGLSKYMQRRVYLNYPVRQETFTQGRDGKEEPWWVQSVPEGMAK
ncbi:hypothetical protein DIPPA_17643 [Diplonema papillatum]|nr:hypothetical protein DIPPA_17643 [Diplonema papillatum]